MNEKAYKVMTFAGAVNLAVGIVISVIGVAAGVLTIITVSYTHLTLPTA